MQQSTERGYTNNDVRVDVSLIPEHVRKGIAAAVLAGVQDYFRQPGVQEKFESWLRERNEKEHRL